MATTSNRSKLLNVGAVVAVVATAGALQACASLGTYVWVDDLSPPAAGSESTDYQIATGDVLSVRAYLQEQLSTRGRVRTDGKMTIPWVGEVVARGKTPAAFAKEVGERLSALLVAPNVTVMVDEPAPLAIPVLGEVARVGIVTVEHGAGLVQLIANAGGLTDFADRDRIFVIRKQPAAQRIRFSYEALTHSIGRASQFVLRPGDTVVVE